MRQSCSILFMFSLFNFVSSSDSKVHLQAKPAPEPDAQDGRVHRKGLRPARDETERRPLLELMSMNLENWGGKSGNSSSALPEMIVVSGDGHVQSLQQQSAEIENAHVNPLAQAPVVANMYDYRGLQTYSLNDALNLHLYSRVTEGNLAQLFMTLSLTLMIVLLLAYCCTTTCWDGPEEEEQKVTKVPNDVKDPARSSDRDEPFDRRSSWARAYFDAHGDEKQAFDLLFRCNIISTEEFAAGDVSEERIQECLWIARNLLDKKSVEEWEKYWNAAQQAFEDSVAEVFEEQGDVGPAGRPGPSARDLTQILRASRSGGTPPGSQQESPTVPTSLPSSANLHYQDPSQFDFRPLQS